MTDILHAFVKGGIYECVRRMIHIYIYTCKHNTFQRPILCVHIMKSFSYSSFNTPAELYRNKSSSRSITTLQRAENIQSADAILCANLHILVVCFLQLLTRSMYSRSFPVGANGHTQKQNKQHQHRCCEYCSLWFRPLIHIFEGETKDAVTSVIEVPVAFDGCDVNGRELAYYRSALLDQWSVLLMGFCVVPLKPETFTDFYQQC